MIESSWYLSTFVSKLMLNKRLSFENVGNSDLISKKCDYRIVDLLVEILLILYTSSMLRFLTRSYSRNVLKLIDVQVLFISWNRLYLPLVIVVEVFE